MFHVLNSINFKVIVNEKDKERVKSFLEENFKNGIVEEGAMVQRIIQTNNVAELESITIKIREFIRSLEKNIEEEKNILSLAMHVDFKKSGIEPTRWLKNFLMILEDAVLVQREKIKIVVNEYVDLRFFLMKFFLDGSQFTWNNFGLRTSEMSEEELITYLDSINRFLQSTLPEEFRELFVLYYISHNVLQGICALRWLKNVEEHLRVAIDIKKTHGKYGVC